jgi:3-oxoacyl-[acyl-carrier protein] reductase
LLPKELSMSRQVLIAGVGMSPDLLASVERSIPLGRGGAPEEAAGAVYLFCIPESDYVSGQTLLCSGGLTGI